MEEDVADLGRQWTITTTDELFKPGGTHLYEGEEAPEEDVDISKVGSPCTTNYQFISWLTACRPTFELSDKYYTGFRLVKR